MIGFSLSTIIKSDERILCWDFLRSESSALLGTQSHIVLYTRSRVFSIPWFGCAELAPCAVLLRYNYASVLLREGFIFVIPLSSITKENYHSLWVRFTQKDFFTLKTHKVTEHETIFDEMLQSLGNCLTGRDREVPNMLDISCFFLKKSKEPLKMVWYESYLVVIFTDGSITILDVRTGKFIKDSSCEYAITQAQLFDNKLLLKTSSVYYAVNLYESIFQESVRLNAVKIPILTGAKAAKARVVDNESKVIALFPGLVKILKSDNIQEFECEFIINMNSFTHADFWQGGIITSTSDTISIFARTQTMATQKRKTPQENTSLCGCGHCYYWKPQSSLDYRNWINGYVHHPEIQSWSVGLDLIDVYALEDEVLLLSETEVVSVEKNKIDSSELFIKAMNEKNSEDIVKLINFMRFRNANLDETFFKIKVPPEEHLLNLRKTILISKDFPYIAKSFLQFKFLWHELYNLSWAFFDSGECSKEKDLYLFQAYILRYLEDNECPDFDDWKAQTPSSCVCSSQVSSYKPLYTVDKSEKLFKEIFRLNYPVLQSKPLCFQTTLRNELPKYFESLQDTLKIKLLVISEQLGMNLPSHLLVFYGEKAKYCILIQALFALTSIDLMFSMISSLLQVDEVIQIFPFYNYTRYDVKTTQISVFEHEKIAFGLGPLVEKMHIFMKQFSDTFYNPQQFPSHFRQSLTRYLLLLGLAIHRSENQNVAQTLNHMNLLILKEFQGFYDMNALIINAGNLRSYLWLAGLYQTQKKWPSVSKALLLHGESQYKVLQICAVKDMKEEDAILIIKNVLTINKESLSTFLSKAQSVLPKEYHCLLEYVVFHFNK